MSSQNRLSQEVRSLTLHAAGVASKAALKKADELGLKVSVCVLDAAGRVKVFEASDGAPPVSHGTAMKKAHTALGFGMPTGDTWWKFIEHDPILREGVGALPEFILLGGGSPLRDGDWVVGAIGVSGGHYKQDELCVLAAEEALREL